MAGNAISPEKGVRRKEAYVDQGTVLKFDKNNDFQQELKRRVDEYFESSGRHPRDNWQMYLKSAILLSSYAGLYVLLVFMATTWWQAVPLALALGTVMALIGFNIQHDAGHQAYSDRGWINKMMSMTIELIGGSAYVWHWRHAVFHHTYVNITDHDTDVDLGFLGRLTPHQKRYAFHRWQHFYLWPLYGFMAIKWQLVNDFWDVSRCKIADRRIPFPKGWDLAIFLGGKITFFTLAFVIPMLFHTWWVVLLYYGLAALAMGVILSIVFQLAHAVEEAEFPMPAPDTGRIESSWAVHQVQTTVNFARRNPVVSWLLGGLNFQIEHHLLPRICHVNYPALAPVVEQTCRDFGVEYHEHPTVWAGLRSHYRWLRQMGTEKGYA